MTDALRARAGGLTDEIADLTAQMVRIPTPNPPGENYRDACDHLAARLRRTGWEVEMLRAEGTPGDSDRYPRWNLVARREGAGPGPCVHLNGHLDVVEAGPGWTRDPWAGEIADGAVWGRGTCDMKGGLAAAILAAEAVLEAGAPGAVEVSYTADEETGGMGGVAWLAGRGAYAHVDHVIIPEPLGADRICVGHRGVWWAEIEAEGRIAHGAMPFLGDCAVRHMGAVLARMERDLWPALARRRTDMPVIPEGARASTLNVNSLHGGQVEPGRDGALPSPNVPGSARMVVDRRFLAEEDVEAVAAEMRALVEDVASERGARMHVRELMRVLPTRTPPDAPVIGALERAIREVSGGPAAHVASPGTYDQKHIDRIGRLRDCFAYGPGQLELAHQPDEHVTLADLRASAEVLALAIRDLLHGPGRPS